MIRRTLAQPNHRPDMSPKSLDADVMPARHGHGVNILTVRQYPWKTAHVFLGEIKLVCLSKAYFGIIDV